MGLLPLFQFWCLLFLFLIWSLWLELQILCWIEVVKMDTFVLFLILVGKFLVFAHRVWCWCRFLICGLYYGEVCSLYSHFAKCFYYKWLLYLIECFFYIYWYDHVIFVFPFMLCITFIDLQIFYHPCIPGINLTWS